MEGGWEFLVVKALLLGAASVLRLLRGRQRGRLHRDLELNLEGLFS